MSKIILATAEKPQYPPCNIFRPHRKYPEVPFDQIASDQNYVYDAVRKAFFLAGYDAEAYGTAQWNPLKNFVHPNDTVLIKPNFVDHANHGNGGTECLYTQPSVIAAVLDYVCIALQDGGKVIIADAPMQSCDFAELCEQSGLRTLLEFYRSQMPTIEFKLKDLRGVHSVYKHGILCYEENQNTRQTIVDLGKNSEFAGLSERHLQNMRITNYDPAILNSHHNTSKHEYAIATEVLEADVIINMPKPKTHRKAGITASLKNMVGVAVRKEYLPHHTNGALHCSNGGDEYLKPSILRRLNDAVNDKRNYYAQTRENKKISWLLLQLGRILTHSARYIKKDKYIEGSWYGNQTISKTITDLNKIIFYADKNGKMPEQVIKPARRYLIVADMIIAGEGEGPLLPTPKMLGLIGVAENPVVFDEVIATLYGAEMEYMHTINQARKTRKYLLKDKNDIGEIISDNILWNKKTWKTIGENEKIYLEPSSGWRDAFFKAK